MPLPPGLRRPPKRSKKLHKHVGHLAEEQQRISTELEAAKVALEQQNKLFARTNVELTMSVVIENEHVVERVVEIVPIWLRDMPEFTMCVQCAIAKKLDEVAKTDKRFCPYH